MGMLQAGEGVGGGGTASGGSAVLEPAPAGDGARSMRALVKAEAGPGL